MPTFVSIGKTLGHYLANQPSDAQFNDLVNLLKTSSFNPNETTYSSVTYTDIYATAGKNVTILEIAVLHHWKTDQVIQLMDNLPFHRNTLSSALSYYLLQRYNDSSTIDFALVEKFLSKGIDSNYNDAPMTNKYGRHLSKEGYTIQEMLQRAIGKEYNLDKNKSLINKLIDEGYWSVHNVRTVLRRHLDNFAPPNIQFVQFMQDKINFMTKLEVDYGVSPKDFLDYARKPHASTSFFEYCCSKDGFFNISKQVVIRHIAGLADTTKQQVLKEALTKGTSLYQFFNVQRGWFACNENSGSFKRLKAMQRQLEDRESKPRLAQTLQQKPESAVNMTDNKYALHSQ